MSEILRRTTLACTVNLIIIGMILTIAAVLTPSWQVVNLQEYYLIHEHGLWFDCKRYIRDGYNVIVKRHRTITEPLHCVYKFDYDKYSGTYAFDDDNSPVGEANRHKFYGWHTCTLILLAISLLVSAFSVCVALCSCRYISLTIVLFITTLVTLCFSNVALGVFFFYSHRANNRFIKGIVTTYEQRVGLAFFMQMGASAFYFIAMVISALSTYFAFTAKGGILDRYSVQNSSKTNMTNIGRLGFQNNAPNSETQCFLINEENKNNSNKLMSSLLNNEENLANRVTNYNDGIRRSASSMGMNNTFQQSNKPAECLLNLNSNKTISSFFNNKTTNCFPGNNYISLPKLKTPSNATVFDASPRTLMSPTILNTEFTTYEKEPYKTRLITQETTNNLSFIDSVNDSKLNSFF